MYRYRLTLDDSGRGNRTTGFTLIHTARQIGPEEPCKLLILEGQLEGFCRGKYTLYPIQLLKMTLLQHVGSSTACHNIIVLTAFCFISLTFSVDIFLSCWWLLQTHFSLSQRIFLFIEIHLYLWWGSGITSVKCQTYVFVWLKRNSHHALGTGTFTALPLGKLSHWVHSSSERLWK